MIVYHRRFIRIEKLASKYLDCKAVLFTSSFIIFAMARQNNLTNVETRKKTLSASISFDGFVSQKTETLKYRFRKNCFLVQTEKLQKHPNFPNFLEEKLTNSILSEVFEKVLPISFLLVYLKIKCFKTQLDFSFQTFPLKNFVC